MKSGYFNAAGSAGGALGAHATTNNSSARRACLPACPLLLMRIALGCTGRSQALDEAARDVGFDHHATVGGDVADDARDTIEPRDLLAIELRVAVERDRDAARIQRHPCRHHLQQLGDALAALRRD